MNFLHQQTADWVRLTFLGGSAIFGSIRPGKWRHYHPQQWRQHCRVCSRCGDCRPPAALCHEASRSLVGDGKNSYAHKMNHKHNFSQICMCYMVWFNSNYPVAILSSSSIQLWKHLFVTHVEMSKSIYLLGGKVISLRG